MEERTSEKNDPALEWFYAKARQYPLLARSEELAIDNDKWRAVRRLFEIMLEHECGRHYLSLWAHNLRDNPPVAGTFSRKEYYNLLRREHVIYSAGTDAEKFLGKLAGGQLQALPCSAGQTENYLTASLTVGLAEVLVGTEEPRDVAAALIYWQQYWVQQPDFETYQISASFVDLISKELNAYYIARSRLVNHNLRLVFSIAGKQQGRLPYRDLVQDGVLGLIRAAEKFDGSKGYKFSTYAYSWIMQAVRRANDELGAIIRFPTQVIEQLTAVQRERARLQHANGREPERKALAKQLDISTAELERLNVLDNRSLSLETKIANDESSLSLGDKLSGELFPSPDGEAERSSLQRLLLERISQLKPEERHVIIRRWGLDQSPASTRKDISAQMRVSTEWVRQIEMSALKKLSHDELIRETHDQYQCD